MIKQRGNRWWFVVWAGRDPLTGRKRLRTGTAATKAEAQWARVLASGPLRSCPGIGISAGTRAASAR